MRASLPSQLISAPLKAEALLDQPDVIQRLLNPLLALAAGSDYLIGGSVGRFLVKRNVFQVPRFVFMGPTGGGDTIRLALFAGFHGDEPEGAEALVEFLQELEGAPQLAAGYHIYAYPLCNPSGFVARTRHPVTGKDLAGQFWSSSSQPEVYYLERELGVHRFHGVISLQTRNHAGGFLLEAQSPVLNEALAPPVLQAAQRFLPGNLTQKQPPASLFDRVLTPSMPDFLTTTDELVPVPFELHLGIPKPAPQPSQIHGTVGALRAILDSYRNLLSIGQNL
jgi:hypothetical protein